MTQADDSTIRGIQQKMHNCVKKMHRLAPQVGAARQVKEFISDQRKNILAMEIIKFIKDGNSAAAAEQYARTSPIYIEKFRQLQEEYAAAESVIAENQATYAAFDAQRSFYAMQRESLHTFQG